MNQNSWLLRGLNWLHQRTVTNRRTCVIANLVSGIIPDAVQIVDVGCGNGRMAQHIMERLKNIQIHGIDVKLTEHAPIPITLYDGRHLPFEDGQFDVAMAIDVLHHCDDPTEILKELARVSRRYVLIKDHIADSWLDFQTLKFMDWFGNRGYGTALPYNYYSSENWRVAFDSCSLRTMTNVSNLGIYPRPFRWVFDRELHFLRLLEKY